MQAKCWRGLPARGWRGDLAVAFPFWSLTYTSTTFLREMAAEAPCTACSWTHNRQDAGRYHSNVKLFHNVSDRAAWSLGPKYIFKERSNQPPSFEARNLRFLKEKTTIPVPTVVLDYDHND
jgi:hypothetical protein